MTEILSWPPILWTARVLVLGILGLFGWIAFWYCIRFFRPANLGRLLRGELPSLEEVQVLGSKVKLQQERSQDIEAMTRNIEERVRVLEDKHNAVAADVDSLNALTKVLAGDIDE